LDDERLKFLELSTNRLEKGIQRNWANSIDPNEAIAPEKAQQIVATILREQLIDMPRKSTELGMKAFHGMLMLQELFPTLEPSDSEIALAIARAKDDYSTFQALRMLVVLGFAEHFVALRGWNRDVMADLVTEPPAPKGPSVFRDTHRNMIVISQIQQLELLKFKPMRSDKKNDAPISGCDIVAGAMTDVGRAMSYSAVESIWKNRNQLSPPQILARMLKQAIVGGVEGKSEKPSGK